MLGCRKDPAEPLRPESCLFAHQGNFSRACQPTALAALYGP
jgi:hypothetical protein